MLKIKVINIAVQQIRGIIRGVDMKVDHFTNGILEIQIPIINFSNSLRVFMLFSKYM